jgi:hypothetical protein
MKSDLPTSCDDPESVHSSSTINSRSSRVSFSTVSFRHHARTISDNPPQVLGGPPIGIDWDYYEGETLNLEDYESGHRRKRNLRLNPITRENMLKNVWGFSHEQLSQAQQEARRVNIQRRETVNQGKLSENTEIMVQSVRRKVGRILRRRS